MSDNYLHQFKVALHELNWGYADQDTPEVIAKFWKDFVQGCQGIYNGSIFDFDEGVIFRTMIEPVFHRTEMRVYPSFQDFEAAIHETDKTFSALTVDARVGEFWWERALLRHTEELYQEQIKLYYGITLQ
ncbi:hypothetical protein CLV59_10521 [Chitinophaga dinghuensis]|uniref:Uncharacterized protein n=1 Tax=Chitinophaga dinghuensis TaxID=1539050 RepID=A0A327VYC1_9BACT|nr:hypothetical protein [Chitinophaga dinghuensis]RAJ79916.1 hypothetical protein CLV59_10521 [Chitinophaga dinghuensis]